MKEVIYMAKNSSIMIQKSINQFDNKKNEKEKNLIFIIPYFGKFNNYFQLFLNSCGTNSEFTWLIFTDDKSDYDYPNNVKVIYMDFKELKNIIKNKFSNINIKIDNPYKLCDLKPAYGYIFSDYIKEFDYWGHCDNDLIFGKISHFIDLNKLSNYDKIGVLGHLTIYKNNDNVNKLFMSTNRFEQVMNTLDINHFDEVLLDSINNIFINNNKQIYLLDKIADICVERNNFQIVNYDIVKDCFNVEKKQKIFFLWNNGVLTKNIIKGKQICEEEYMYIHLQKRKMKVLNKNTKIYKIIPNSFDDIEESYFSKNYKKIKTKHINLHYIKYRTKCLINKLKTK